MSLLFLIAVGCYLISGALLAFAPLGPRQSLWPFGTISIALAAVATTIVIVAAAFNL